ncbi:response regulator transcription factor [Variovorax sp. J22P240]|uniref:response regulator transcription factor n=1 Tax=Variovorax sp. J22P240 TaxID=3053514 RepID=UPI002577AD4E|nr:response regulator transcription factor [Variovorax sp. J22P240]MDM0001091.1 response regulator transcription factor [Variovorax sp. J22P240]
MVIALAAPTGGSIVTGWPHWHVEWFPVHIHSQENAVPNSDACVVVIDDDTEFRESLERLLRSAGLRAQAFASIAEFAKAESPDSPTCLVLDVRMPGRSGLEFQRDLAAAGVELPIVFITGHGDIPMTVQAMKAGAIEFLTKPFRDQDLLDAVNVGLARDRARRAAEGSLTALRAQFQELTPRERAILLQVVQGRLNKQIAGDLGVTETTVKVHRSNMMRKVGAASLPELCRMADRLNLLRTKSDHS